MKITLILFLVFILSLIVGCSGGDIVFRETNIFKYNATDVSGITHQCEICFPNYILACERCNDCDIMMASSYKRLSND